MFEKFRELLDRLPYYARPNIDVALKKLLAKDIALILEIMGLSTKLIEDRRGSGYHAIFAVKNTMKLITLDGRIFRAFCQGAYIRR